MNKPKWCHLEDDNRQLYGDEELEKYIVAKGLPHWNGHIYSQEEAPTPYPETTEPIDRLTEEGERLARSDSGRSQLPWK